MLTTPGLRHLSIVIAIVFTFFGSAAGVEAQPGRFGGPQRVPRATLQRTISEMLQQSREAAERGDLATARNLWVKVKALDRNRPKPRWLNPAAAAPTTRNEAPPMSRTEMLAISGTQGPAAVREQLNAWLLAHPSDHEVRAELLRLAEAEGDEAATRRHRSILLPGENDEYGWPLIFVLLVVWGVIIDQGRRFWQELRERRHAGPTLVTEYTPPRKPTPR